MKTKYIKIESLTDLSKFVIEASKVDGDILIYRGKYCIDGKSMLGIMSIDISDKCKIEYPEDAIEFEKYIKQFEI